MEHLDAGPEDVRELLHEVILLIGYFVSMNPRNQEMMKFGPTSVIQRLCNLPIAYFNDKKYVNVLFPTLIAICYENERNYSILQHEMSVELLINYIKQQAIVHSADDMRKEDHKSESRSNRSLSISSSNSYSKSILAAASFKLVFLNRFPRKLWEDAVGFFSSKVNDED